MHLPVVVAIFRKWQSKGVIKLCKVREGRRDRRFKYGEHVQTVIAELSRGRVVRVLICHSANAV